ncbi:hypothetical protein N836_22385 [Leptolyngbya sp. Heron Island J]|uniref:hypothetical protein n=1 Tax=Leptolyngbya sp. Heron Island J TaxID=1385935 RepID=UPI0003B99C9F|nr:hypothetical protein [Leptolyngbya sp. Heron Island J]ESA33142.1 hypothetical protein N836_22385 [Leptolyngbya sp. Heron Island J]
MLELDKDDKVSLTRICGQTLEPNGPAIESWIKPIAPDTVPAFQPAKGTTFELGA